MQEISDPNLIFFQGESAQKDVSVPIPDISSIALGARLNDETKGKITETYSSSKYFKVSGEYEESTEVSLFNAMLGFW